MKQTKNKSLFFERQRQIRPVARNCTVVHSDSSDFYNKTYIRVELTCFYFAVFVCAQIHFANAYVFPYNYIVLKLDVFLIKPNLNFNVTFPNYCNNTNIRSSICLIIRKKNKLLFRFVRFSHLFRSLRVIFHFTQTEPIYRPDSWEANTCKVVQLKQKSCILYFRDLFLHCSLAELSYLTREIQ